MSTTRRQVPVFPPGTYWCAVVSYYDGSSVLGVYGPYPTEEAATANVERLMEVGVHRDHNWQVKPLHLFDLGTEVAP